MRNALKMFRPNRKPRRPNLPRLRPLALMLIASSAMILAACGSQTATAQLGTPTGSANGGKPLACSEFQAVTRHLGKIDRGGKPDVSKDDVIAALAQPNWLQLLHAIMGDTDATLAANQANNQVWHRLCD